MPDLSLKWTDEEAARLKELVAEQKLSFSQIGELLGKTKSACIGRAHRMGLCGRLAPKPDPLREQRRAAREAKKPWKPEVTQNNSLKPRYAQPLAAETPFGEPESILGLKEHMCRWPTHFSERSGRQLFCGAPRAGHGPYCAEHHAIAWRPAAMRVRDFERMARAVK